MWLLLAGIAAQAADALTMRWTTEVNPVVLHLGSLAYLAKILLVVAAVALAWSLPRLSAGRARTRRLTQWASATLGLVLAGAGLLGAVTNLLS